MIQFNNGFEYDLKVGQAFHYTVDILQNFLALHTPFPSLTKSLYERIVFDVTDMRGLLPRISCYNITTKG